MLDPIDAHAAWSRKYTAARLLFDRESVQICRLACPFFPPYTIIYNKLAANWYIQRDRNCIAAWQLKSRSPWARAVVAAR